MNRLLLLKLGVSILTIGFLLDVITTTIGINLGFKESNPLYYKLGSIGFFLLKSMINATMLGLYYVQNRNQVLYSCLAIIPLGISQLACGIHNLLLILGSV